MKNFVYGADEGFRPTSNIIAPLHLSIPSIFFWLLRRQIVASRYRSVALGAFVALDFNRYNIVPLREWSPIRALSFLFNLKLKNLMMLIMQMDLHIAGGHISFDTDETPLLPGFWKALLLSPAFIRSHRQRREDRLSNRRPSLWSWGPIPI